MIIFINGSTNAGKSTVARLLKEKILRPAVVEVDSLHAFIDWVDIDEVGTVLLDSAADVIRNFVRREYNVIVPCPLSNEDYAYITTRLSDVETKIYAFTLRPSIEKAQTDTPLRKLSNWEKNRIPYNHSIGLVNPSFGSIIDNTDQTPEETTAVILKVVSEN